MSYRFLPWVRRGLAAEVPDADGLGATMPARARLPVRLTLAHGPQVALDLELYGPGDVTGLDTRAIVRTEPRRGTTNFAPDQFASIEFDPPDLPWLLSPMRAGGNDKLRPWLALVVVARQPGVEIEVKPNRPLPRLVIGTPASAAAELPDLDESWAWAHVHMVEASAGGDTAGRLAAEPDLNVSRLLCPRRLEPDREYVACLVPTTEAGRLAGLGDDPGDDETTGPAWSGGTAATLPLYYHWFFRTGPEGDFESLARRLVPRPVPATVGRRPMFVGAADPALPVLAPDAGGVLALEGALRAPGPADEDEPAPALVDALVRVLDAPSEHLDGGAPDGAEAVAPPIYGQWPVRRHTVPATATDEPRWLRELNVDPRHRAAAGLGAQVVRENQERYVAAAWKQVGDVLAANRLLDHARLMRRIGERMLVRHVAPLGDDALFALAAPVHGRIRVGGQTVERRLGASPLPDGASDAAFRRMAAPGSQILRRVRRLDGGAGPAAPATVLAELARGELRFDPLGAEPDGIVGSSVIGGLPAASGGVVSGASLGLPGRVGAQIVERWTGAQAALAQQPAGTVVLHPNLGLGGVVGEFEVEAVAAAAGPRGSLHGALGQIIGSIVNRPARGRGAGGPLGPLGPVQPPRRPPIVLTIPNGPVIDVEPPHVLPASVSAMVGAFQAQHQTFEASVVPLRPPPAPVELSGLRPTVFEALDPAPVIARRALGRLTVAGGPLADQDLGDRLRPTDDLGPIMAGPLLTEALYRDLAAYDQDRFLPGAGEIPTDTVTLLETNPRFVEAFLVGANHEMSRELLWRRYPTDRRGTPFRRFWERLDGQTDIGPIHQFASATRLGTNSTGVVASAANGPPEGTLVLLVRGDLLKRYPNSVIYAVPAAANGRLDPATPITLPVFAGRVDPDLSFVGFDLTEEQIEPAPGWLFVIAEQPTEPRFGLDVPDPGAAEPAAWDGLDWRHVGVAPGGHLRLTDAAFVGVTKPLAARAGSPGSVGQAEFGRNAGHMAAITFQRPFRAVIHSSKLLAGVRGEPA
jgi:hypothetical protein